VVRLEKKGGVFSFLGHQVSSLFVSLSWRIPGLRWTVFFINSWLVTRSCYVLDACFDRNGIIPLGYVAIALKP